MDRSILDRLPRSPIDHDEIRRFQEETLREVAKGGGDRVFAEMAREVQAGHMTLREAADSLAYRDAFARAADEFAEALEPLSPEEIQQLAQDRAAPPAVDNIAEATPDTSTANAAAPPATQEDGDDDYSHRTIMSVRR
ncbi:hypothetical protein DL990_33835 [Amycolatopsis sp. WAC 01416]|uniref:hypothetical protein n=1 Tax=Amycolatopsis sp. WAC 01416 TaxID=2203196 RepID=UPI000F7693E2|nr:hypothetical protein [Amycolatopsis sp. WAC 01416]RSN24865.1 hypothetical protein DL990_33835 [Amycolatopsis sp. WAC 01416]